MIRRKLPQLLLEVASVVFAVLVALAVDEWRQDRENGQLAQRALAGIATEIRGNLGELDDARDANRAMLVVLDSALTSETPQGFGVHFEYALLSSAAWQTSQVTQAIHFVDYGLVQRIARVYDLQTLFVESQRGLVDQMSGTAGVDDPVAPLRRRLEVLMELEAGLTDVYREILPELPDG
ncbi:MAG: hypothetical protein P8170_05245 [Gemmatimonadota bacterium]